MLVLALSLAIQGLHAQSHLSVDISDPVYRLIEVGELRGAVSRLSSARPFTRSQVRRLLERMSEKPGVFSAAERQILEEELERFGGLRKGLAYGNYTEIRGDRSIQVGGNTEVEAHLNANRVEDWHLQSLFRPYFQGDLASWLSYMGASGITYDRVSEGAFAPYAFTKEWDGFHVSFGDPRYSAGDLDYPTISFRLETDVAASFYDGDVTLRLARMRREWGTGDGSLVLSGTARPFVGVEAHTRFAPWLSLSYVFGSLADPSREAGGAAPHSSLLTYEKMFALQRLEVFPSDWLYVGASSSVIGAKRVELGYLSPLIFSTIYQNSLGDLDNLGVSAEWAVTWAPFGKAYFNFYADEMEITNPSELFTRPRNMFAFQGGVKVPVPGLPFTLLTLQYTKIEPFAYAHYPSWHSDERRPVETSYTHDGENLAYYLYPNSDELLVKLTTSPVPGLQAGLEYRLIRHGDNPSSGPGDLAILGRPEAYLDYSVGLDAYPDKNFLSDGLYDINHVVSLSGEYAIPGTPVSVGLSYTFAYTAWDANASGEARPPNELRNLLGLTVKVFR